MTLLVRFVIHSLPKAQKSCFQIRCRTHGLKENRASGGACARDVVSFALFGVLAAVASVAGPAHSNAQKQLYIPPDYRHRHGCVYSHRICGDFLLTRSVKASLKAPVQPCDAFRVACDHCLAPSCLIPRYWIWAGRCPYGPGRSLLLHNMKRLKAKPLIISCRKCGGCDFLFSFGFKRHSWGAITNGMF